MLAAALRLVGFDLDAQIANLKGQVEEFKQRATREAEAKIKETGITIGFALVGGIAALWTVVIGLIALYLWVAMKHGPFAGLGVVGLTTAACAALMFALAASRGGKTTATPRSAMPPPAAVHVPPRPAVSLPPLSSFAPPPPSTAPILDQVTHRVAARAMAASDEAVETATDLVKHGSRGALIGTLAVAALVGLIVGRRQPRDL
jgi:hypothetical protein